MNQPAQTNDEQLAAAFSILQGHVIDQKLEEIVERKSPPADQVLQLALAVLERIRATEHQFGGALQGDGQFAYRVPESIFRQAEEVLAIARGKLHE